MKRLWPIVVNAIPVFIMIGLIPYVASDFLLTIIYAAIIAVAFSMKRTKNDFLALALGIGIMTVMEYLFVASGVEIFTRRTLFNAMPLWLPILWGYGFVAIKRSVRILNA